MKNQQNAKSVAPKVGENSANIRITSFLEKSHFTWEKPWVFSSARSSQDSRCTKVFLSIFAIMKKSKCQNRVVNGFSTLVGEFGCKQGRKLSIKEKNLLDVSWVRPKSKARCKTHTGLSFWFPQLPVKWNYQIRRTEKLA